MSHVYIVPVKQEFLRITAKYIVTWAGSQLDMHLPIVCLMMVIYKLDGEFDPGSG
jgi:hypothetical protein